MTPSASGRLGLLLGDRSVVFLFEMCGKNFSVFTPSCLDHPLGVFFLQSHIIPRELLGKYSQYLTEMCANTCTSTITILSQCIRYVISMVFKFGGRWEI